MATHAHDRSHDRTRESESLPLRGNAQLHKRVRCCGACDHKNVRMLHCNNTRGAEQRTRLATLVRPSDARTKLLWFKQPNYAWLEAPVNINAKVATMKQYPFQSDFAQHNLEILAHLGCESAAIADRFDIQLSSKRLRTRDRNFPISVPDVGVEDFSTSNLRCRK